MTLEQMKLKAEQAAVAAARMGMEVKVLELEQAIQRTKADIDAQLKRESEISEKLNQLNK